MFNANPKTLQRIAPKIERVLIVDANPYQAKLLAELCRELGSRQIMTAHRSDQAMTITAEFKPDLIFTEYSAPNLDGIEFTKALRRSPLDARKAPVVMVTAEATAASIVAARNSGVHEFLRKPFTAGDLFRRIENVALKPRLWIEAQMYVGPDRRRFNSEDYGGAKKRNADKGAAAPPAEAQAKAG